MKAIIIAGAILTAFGGAAWAGGADPLDFTDRYGPYVALYVARSTYLIAFAPQPTGGPLTWWYTFDSLQACRNAVFEGAVQLRETGRGGALFCREDPNLVATSVRGVGADRSMP
jgi:hypothetical protein